MASTAGHPGFQAFLEKHRISLSDLAREVLGVDPSTMWRKANGSRPLKLTEAQAILDYLRRRLNQPTLSLDDIGFGADVDATPEATEAQR